MGCCASKASSAPRSEHSFQRSKHTRASTPHPIPEAEDEEEETVKEVLSEIPTPKPSIPKISDHPTRDTPRSPTLQKILQQRVSETNDLAAADAVSEICSTSSDFLSAVGWSDKRFNEEYAGRAVDNSPSEYRNRSFSGGPRPERMAGGVSGFSPSRIRNIPGAGTRGPPEEERRRKDSGDRSGRRAPSPASGGDRNGGSRVWLGRSTPERTARNPGRFGSDKVGMGRGSEENKWPPTTKESLENPLVSLECFIFL